LPLNIEPVITSIEPVWCIIFLLKQGFAGYFTACPITPASDLSRGIGFQQLPPH
jgi:hypothetical protein